MENKCEFFLLILIYHFLILPLLIQIPYKKVPYEVNKSLQSFFLNGKINACMCPKNRKYTAKVLKLAHSYPLHVFVHYELQIFCIRDCLAIKIWSRQQAGQSSALLL